MSVVISTVFHQRGQNKNMVLQAWLGELPWKQQSAILSALRGPDMGPNPKIKEIIRWLRRSTGHDADPSSGYLAMVPKLPTNSELIDELTYTSVHFAFHLIEALEIIGYTHPDEEINTQAREYYQSICQKLLHTKPESKEEMDKRLADTAQRSRRG